MTRRREFLRQASLLMPTGVFATCHAQSLGCGVLNAV
jgi:hypothetical protein